MWLNDEKGNTTKYLSKNKIKIHNWSEEKLQELATI